MVLPFQRWIRSGIHKLMEVQQWSGKIKVGKYLKTSLAEGKQQRRY